MFTQDLQAKIDQVWLAFHSGGLSNPLSVIEQITFLLFIKQLDELQNRIDQEAIITGEVVNPIYSEFDKNLRWSHFKNLSPEEMYKLFQKEGGVFDFMKSYGGRSSSFSKFMKNANFIIPTARLLAQVVEMLDKIDMQDKDTKGDVYEYMLSKIATSGSNGQFRTPRHIIKMMVDMMQPTLEDVICDPSAGSCGFLVGGAEYVQTHYKQELLKPSVQEHYLNDMFIGMEFDPTMIRIGAMNLILHGIENPQLKDVDSLSQANSDFEEKASLILANPPFKGSLDKDAVDEKVIALVDSKKTELLFLGLMLKGLKLGGRCAVIIPDGVLFGSTGAHKKIRKELVENQTLEAVISMPSGVFRPYAGVSTAVLIFTKTNAGGTDKVWFYDMKADGFSLDDKRTPTKENDIPDAVTRFLNRANEVDRARTEQSFVVPKQEIADNDYDLSINKYKEVEYEQKVYATPVDIIANIQKLDEERKTLLDHLKLILL
ncbi:N-6 DNA methylase [Chryseobacterium sp. POL2]|uniref:class I SAM-dependent DNA methyltransferase n=1 Tax=Chryseobacterium sp. POL2 TaxID=2713414 RepID=UPI0013E15DE4|nr:class I SAM-dependent DNA methyltransferase [Chryseobacterium sp. POL2]QIG89897.1 N-6 DNA methylase [Chryseobacterium sp. POL2]